MDTIGGVVLAFLQERLQAKRGIFLGEDLRQYVIDHELVAPDSPGRMLRRLRQKGVIEYQVLSRTGSLYEVLSAAPPDAIESEVIPSC